MPAGPEVLRDLVTANRILAHEGVVDSFGHVSLRHPENPERYLLSWARAPELIEADDIVEFLLDGEGIDLRGRRPYGERMIHGAIYEMRPDVHAVIHNHSYDVIPFASTAVPIRPVMHTCGVIGSDIPVWDIRDRFGDTDHLVVTMDQGRDLSACLGDRSIGDEGGLPAGKCAAPDPGDADRYARLPHAGRNRTQHNHPARPARP